MVRVVVENILLFLAPTAVYVAYMLFVKRTGQSPKEVLDQGPLVWLSLAGVGMIAAVLLVFGTKGALDEGRAGGVYIPPTYKDGAIVPGKVK
jgi:Family of unknown function (DUF6111)